MRFCLDIPRFLPFDELGTGFGNSRMFMDVSRAIGHNPPRLHSGVAVADLDGDGRSEFVVGGFGGPNRLLRWGGHASGARFEEQNLAPRIFA